MRCVAAEAVAEIDHGVEPRSQNLRKADGLRDAGLERQVPPSPDRVNGAAQGTRDVDRVADLGPAANDWPRGERLGEDRDRADQRLPGVLVKRDVAADDGRGRGMRNASVLRRFRVGSLRAVLSVGWGVPL